MKTTWLNPKAIFLATVIGVCAWVFIDQLSFPQPSRNFIGDTKRAELSVNGPITQVFRIRENGLEGFQVFMGDTDLALGERIDFTLMDTSCATTINQMRRTMFSLSAIRDVRFMFPTISDSADRQYCLSIEYHPGFMKKKERPYIRVTEDEQSKDISYTDHGKEKTYVGRTLQVRPLYAPMDGTVTARIMVLENRLSQYKPAFIKGSMLTLGASGFFLAIAFFAWIARRREE